MRCSTYVNLRRMDVRPYGEPLEVVDYFNSMGSQGAVDGGCDM